MDGSRAAQHVEKCVSFLSLSVILIKTNNNQVCLSTSYSISSDWLALACRLSVLVGRLTRLCSFKFAVVGVAARLIDSLAGDKRSHRLMSS